MPTRLGALVAGTVLFALPFLQSGLGESSAHHTGAHMDHTPHHGGSLLMLGEHHLEVVERERTLEMYVSDAERRPVRPLSASVVFDGGEVRAMAWSGYRLVAPRPAGYAWADYRIALEGAVPLAIRLPASGVAMPRTPDGR